MFTADHGKQLHCYVVRETYVFVGEAGSQTPTGVKIRFLHTYSYTRLVGIPI